jgi:hypothetical protein
MVEFRMLGGEIWMEVESLEWYLILWVGLPRILQNVSIQFGVGTLDA